MDSPTSRHWVCPIELPLAIQINLVLRSPARGSSPFPNLAVGLRPTVPPSISGARSSAPTLSLSFPSRAHLDSSAGQTNTYHSDTPEQDLATPQHKLGPTMARRTFFSFHYGPDVWRAWNVRNCWVVRPQDQIDSGFFDSSVFEASKKESDDALKAFLRKGMDNTSVTCVLSGARTSERRWVRYEIARSMVKGNGLLTVFIHGVENSKQQTSQKGSDPLSQVGLYRSNDRIYLAELKGGKWVHYSDYSRAIPKAYLWCPAPTTKQVTPLSNHCQSYNFVNRDGRTNIGSWIEAAARSAGR